jgi:hypothetical protein
MARIRLLVPVAGDLAPGVPAPAIGVPVTVDDTIADSWCDGERAEHVADTPLVEVEAVHADARTYLAAVQEQHEVEVEGVHAGAREYLAAVEAQHAEQVSLLERQLAAKPARGKKPETAGE